MGTEATETDVLIAGAGPGGMALAIELGRRGLRAILIESQERAGRNPRAKTTNVRSMEHMRRWGLAAEVRAEAPLPLDYARDVVFATRLFGHPIHRFENALFMGPAGDQRFSEPSQWIPQYRLEDVLRRHIATLPSVTLRLGARLEAAHQDAGGVTAIVADVATGASQSVSARYLAGADGARSTTREIIGARMAGEHGFASFLSLVVHAPGLAEAHPQAPAIMYWLLNTDGPALMGPMDRGDLWFWIGPVAPDVRPDAAEARRRVVGSLGATFPFEIVTVDPWLAHRLMADKYRDRRMFLIGDACHLHPPFGGYGMNMGIGDAVDLGWKLAAVLQGWGGATLLDSYEIERRPVHRWTIDEAVENVGFFRDYFADGRLEADTADGVAARASLAAEVAAAKTREFRALGMVLGARYDGSPVIAADGRPAPRIDPLNYEPSAAPGGRAPHVWLGQGRSLFDAFGPGFTLLVTAGDGAGPEVAALVRTAATVGVPLVICAPGHAALPALYGARFALIRPDQHVAWRGDAAPADWSALLDLVCGRDAASSAPEIGQLRAAQG